MKFVIKLLICQVLNMLRGDRVKLGFLVEGLVSARVELPIYRSMTKTRYDDKGSVKRKARERERESV